jgi:hypothetical protein
MGFSRIYGVGSIFCSFWRGNSDFYGPSIMKLRDFLYHYTDIYFSEAVKETILIENWEEKDFAYRHAEYFDVFLKIYKECFPASNQITDDEIHKILNDHKNKIVTSFNKKMLKNFLDEFNKIGIDNEKASRLMPKNIFRKHINTDALKLFRAFEEDTLKYNKQEGRHPHEPRKK